MTGFGTLLRLALRRDRWLAPLWIVVFVANAAGSAAATIDLYPDVASRVKASLVIDANPALRALYGRIYDPGSLGGISMIKVVGLGTAFVALLCALLVVRHTRANEEVGRTELLAAGVVGRYAAAAAAMAEATLVAVTLGLATALSLVAVGLDVSGSLAFGLAWALAGTVFAGVALVAAQLCRTARAARGLAASVLVAAYVVRAVGDASTQHWLSWLSPIGWSQQVRPYAGDRWWAALPSLVATALLVAAAARLLDRRDLGAGVLPDRPGPAHAAPGLASPYALAWRQHRIGLVGWTVGFAGLGLLLGTVVGDVQDAVDSDAAREMIEKLGGVAGLQDAYVSTELGFLAVFASAFGISALSRLAAEESQGRAEVLLSTAVDRTRLLLAHLAVALGGVTLLVLVVGLGLGITHAGASGDAGNLGRDLAAAAARLPAAWVMTGLAALCYGAFRSVAAAWALLTAFTLTGLFGELFGLPTWAQDLSPYAHVPDLPGGAVHPAQLVLLAVLAGVLMIVAVAGFRHRDVVSG